MRRKVANGREICAPIRYAGKDGEVFFQYTMIEEAVQLCI